MTAMRAGDRLERADRVLEHGEREAEGRWQARSTVLLVSGDMDRGKEENTGKAIRTNDGDGVCHGWAAFTRSRHLAVPTLEAPPPWPRATQETQGGVKTSHTAALVCVCAHTHTSTLYTSSIHMCKHKAQIHTNVCIHSCAHTRTDAHTSAHLTYTYVHTKHTYTQTCASTLVHALVHRHICTSIHTYTHLPYTRAKTRHRYTQTCASTPVHTHRCTSTHICTHQYTHMHTDMCASTPVHVLMCTHKHRCTKSTHAHTHVQMDPTEP